MRYNKIEVTALDTEKIIEEIRRMEKQNRDLKHEKAQAEAFLALVLKKSGPVEIAYSELFKVDAKKVKVVVDDKDETKAKMYYAVDEGDEEK